MKLFRNFLLVFLCSAIWFTACKNVPKNKLHCTSFYYWKTTYNPTSFEKKYVVEHDIKNMYIRCFDVMASNGNTYRPSNVLLWHQKPISTINYIPVVFIDKKIFETITDTENIAFAKKIIGLCKQILTSQNLEINEIQIDCDWASLSKEKYFNFLQCIRQQMPIVSATLRLHQYKYQTQSGIPPVDYCSLMCYNIGDIKSNDNANSILNLKDFESYTVGKNYPLAYNIALPIYTWQLLFRNNQFNHIERQNERFDNAYWAKTNNNTYMCTNSFFDTMNSTYFYKNDVIKLEKWSKHEWITITNHIIKTLKNPKNEVIYFDMDSASIKNYLLP